MKNHHTLRGDSLDYAVITRAIEAIPNNKKGMACEIGLRKGAGSGFIKLDVDDGTGLAGSVDDETINWQFLNKVHSGVATIPGVINSAFILGLTNDNLQAGRGQAVTLTTGVGTYAWFAYPTAYGLGFLQANGLGADTTVVTISHTNDNSHVEDYFVVRTSNDNLGTFFYEIV